MPRKTRLSGFAMTILKIHRGKKCWIGTGIGGILDHKVIELPFNVNTPISEVREHYRQRGVCTVYQPEE
jgi:hypothetical protein